MKWKLQESNVNGISLAVVAVAALAIAAYLEAVSPPPPSVVWLDIRAYLYTRSYHAYPKNDAQHPTDDPGPLKTVNVYGAIRSAPAGSLGLPWTGPIPAPVRDCSLVTAGEFDQPGSPWYCPDDTRGAGQEWWFAWWPPLQPCSPSILDSTLSGFRCSRGAVYYPDGRGYFWRPERRKKP